VTRTRHCQLLLSHSINTSLLSRIGPLLFNIALEKATRSAEIQTDLLSARSPKLLLAYADVIDIIGDCTPTVKGIFHRIEEATREVGLTRKGPNICA